MRLTVRRLKAEDDRTEFHSGDVDLDRFFAPYAGQNQFRHHIGTTYVAVDEHGRIVGFATVAPSELVLARVPASSRKGLPKYPMPVLRLARLAVDARAQGKGVGVSLLQSVMTLAQQLAESVGCLGLVVDAKPGAVRFYEKRGFVPLEAAAGLLGDRPEPLPMFLELGQLTSAD